LQIFFVSRLLLHLLLCLRTRKNKTQYEIHERVCFKVFLSSCLHLLFCLCLKIGVWNSEGTLFFFPFSIVFGEIVDHCFVDCTCGEPNQPRSSSCKDACQAHSCIDFPPHMLCIPLVPSLSPVFLLRLICLLVLSSFGMCSGSLKGSNSSSFG
jgi:hypothetical protein